MELFTIYYGTPQGKQTKIGVDCSYPKRIKAQKIHDGQILEVHTCVYEVSKREQELQRQYGVKVDTTPYYVNYFRNKTTEFSAMISQSNSVNKIGNTYTRGSKLSEETKAKITASKIGVAQRIVECPHCTKQGGIVNMIRYHFDNCKHKTHE